ncbi:uncharacterized protein LOC116114220 isoform X1 [Pistacia vera]|uniref:uncharacterized protein LOC116114220 isoform X1 n=1 Tax=Pistacia vera TaxID=55513 RepID=UPI001262EC91|nr:uncharacterized protein LOC116114220 isoform X1 [Pistacia vera]
MSNGTVRKVSHGDLQTVQNLIERCLQLYMNQKEVMETLLAQAKIEPGFTELVWQKLEEENREFFRAYYLRLMVKHQIIEFNKLLEQQLRLMSQIHPPGVAPIPNSNRSRVPPLPQNSASYPIEHTGPAIKLENVHHLIGSSVPNTFIDGRSSLCTSLPSAIEVSSQVSRVDNTTNLLSTKSRGLIEGMKGGMVKSEVGYSGSSPYMFGADGNVLEARPSVADASVASFSSGESTSQTLNEPLLDADTSSFGFLGQIPRNFSLSDLTADFSHSSDILESYSRSPFLVTDTENFLNSCERESQETVPKLGSWPTGDNKRLDIKSEGIGHGDFGSE